MSMIRAGAYVVVLTENFSACIRDEVTKVFQDIRGRSRIETNENGSDIIKINDRCRAVRSAGNTVWYLTWH